MRHEEINILFVFLFYLADSSGQNIPAEYSILTKKADSFYNAKEYKNSALTYSGAFQILGGKGTMRDRYNAACSWALAGYPDSAFFNLERISTMLNYSNYSHISIDPDLKSLYSDKRWKPLLELVKANKDKTETFSNKELAHELDTIYEDDQKYRMQLEEVEQKYGWQSNETRDLWNVINAKDAENLIKIETILDKYGWLGNEEIGTQGNMTLFLVIQHADLSTQEKYLPMMRETVRNGRAKGYNLALLEDRVALGEGKKQIYGSQVRQNPQTHSYYVCPLEDPDNVDQRRAKVGLSPLSQYITHWNMKWDVEQYKKELPELELLQWGKPSWHAPFINKH